MITTNGETFEILPDGREVRVWDLRTPGGAGPRMMDLGATILSLAVPDRDGVLADVTLGFDRAASYLADGLYFGAVVGRFANRIAGGCFTLGGQRYQLPINDPPNTLHGGELGFDKQLWHGEAIRTGDGAGVRFALISEDGDQGFPGTVTTTTTYVWTADDRLIVDFTATTDAPTPFSVAQHAYWNLGGADAATSAMDHELQIAASRYTPVDTTLIPTGALADVGGTAFDFRVAKPIGQDIERSEKQLALGGGYDHNWALDNADQGVRQVATLRDPGSGRRMFVLTDRPGMQFYSGNFLDGTVIGKGGAACSRRSGVALETQAFPDAPNQADFPTAILRPGEDFHSRTIFAFDCAEA